MRENIKDIIDNISFGNMTQQEVNAIGAALANSYWSRETLRAIRDNTPISEISRILSDEKLWGGIL